MITAFRKQLGTLILWGIIGIVSVGLLVYLLPGYVGSGPSGGRTGGNFVVATVGGDGILYDHFAREYARQINVYRRLLGDRFDESKLDPQRLRDQVLNGLILRRVLLQRAKALGIAVTPEELVLEIKALPVFAQRGFSKADYMRVLQQMRTTPEEFEASLRQDLVVHKLEELVKAGVKVSEGEVRDLYNAERQKLTVEYIEWAEPAKAKEAADKVAVAISQGKDFGAAARAAGVTLHTISLEGSGGEPKGIKDPAAFRQAAMALKMGQVSSLIEAPTAAYLLRVTEKEFPTNEQFEKEKVGYRRFALGRKRELVFQEWVREAQRGAKVWVDREALGG